MQPAALLVFQDLALQAAAALRQLTALGFRLLAQQFRQPSLLALAVRRFATLLQITTALNQLLTLAAIQAFSQSPQPQVLAAALLALADQLAHQLLAQLLATATTI